MAPLTLASELRNQQQRAPILTPTQTDLDAYRFAVNDIYQTSNDTNDPRMVAAYDAMAAQLLDQYTRIIRAGIHIRFEDYDPTPTDEHGRISFKLMLRHVWETNELLIFRTAPDDVGPLTNWETRHDGRYENMNSIFRAVHDFYGHLATGSSFGWKGETTAYYSHASMFTPDALPALFSETVAQQCVYAVTNDYAEQKSVWYAPDFFTPPLS